MKRIGSAIRRVTVETEASTAEIVRQFSEVLFLTDNSNLKNSIHVTVEGCGRRPPRAREKKSEKSFLKDSNVYDTGVITRVYVQRAGRSPTIR
jgi:hypothetical protein